MQNYGEKLAELAVTAHDREMVPLTIHFFIEIILNFKAINS